MISKLRTSITYSYRCEHRQSIYGYNIGCMFLEKAIACTYNIMNQKKVKQNDLNNTNHLNSKVFSKDHYTFSWKQ